MRIVKRIFFFLWAFFGRSLVYHLSKNFKWHQLRHASRFHKCCPFIHSESFWIKDKVYEDENYIKEKWTEQHQQAAHWMRCAFQNYFLLSLFCLFSSHFRISFFLLYMNKAKKIFFIIRLLLIIIYLFIE